MVVRLIAVLCAAGLFVGCSDDGPSRTSLPIAETDSPDDAAVAAVTRFWEAARVLSDPPRPDDLLIDDVATGRGVAQLSAVLRDLDDGGFRVVDRNGVDLRSEVSAIGPSMATVWSCYLDDASRVANDEVVGHGLLFDSGHVRANALHMHHELMLTGGVWRVVSFGIFDVVGDDLADCPTELVPPEG